MILDIRTLFALLILFIPLISFGLQIFFGSRIGTRGVWISVVLEFSTLILALSMLFTIILGPAMHHFPSITWFDLGQFEVTLGLYLDNISVVMLVIVGIISALVHLYSVEYMRGDIRYTRYFGYLGLFTFSMNGIVLAHSLIMMYIFWELVGLSSYLLIGHWFEKRSAADAGKKAFLTNRVGDIGMFLGIMLFWSVAGTFTFHGLSAAVEDGIFAGQLGLLSIAGVLIFMGAVGKSAQFPLHIWLPDAMEGPTPVSALIHAATMVAAGVYMLVRIFPILTPDALAVIAAVGGITALMAAVIAMTQFDIKRVLAYSTVSQLGYMVMAVGVGAQQYAFFHLATHAMFKGLLFLCSGSVIHAMHRALHHLKDHDTDAQDMRNMGGLKERMPVTYWTMLIGALAISGVPLFSGFLSKDAILAGTLAYATHHHGFWVWLLPVAGFGAAAITAFYMFRLIFMTFHSRPARTEISEQVRETPMVMTAPLVLLAALSFALAFTFPHLNPLEGEGWFDSAIQQSENVTGFAELETETLEHGFHAAHLPAMAISLTVAALGILFSFLFYFFETLDKEVWAGRFRRIGLYQLSKRKFYFDEIYNALLYRPFLWLADVVRWIDWDLYDQIFVDGWGRVTMALSNLSGWLDFHWLDQIIVDGIGRITRVSGKVGRKLQTGKVQNYLLWAMTGGVLIFLIIQYV